MPETISFDFNKVPSDVALLLTQSPELKALALKLATVMDMTVVDANMLHDVLIGAVAGALDQYMKW